MVYLLCMVLKIGAKFIGLVILYCSIVKNTYKISNLSLDNINNNNNTYIDINNKGSLIENIGSNTILLDNVKGIFSDIGTVINLFIASIFGIPVSTTHVKTMSIISLGEKDSNVKNIKNIFKAWIWTFPVCFILSYIFSKILMFYYLK